MRHSTLVALYFISACANDHERGESTDAPVEDRRAVDATTACETCNQVDAAAALDASAESQPLADGSARDASLARGTPGDESCILKPITCAAETVDVRGTSPWGELHIRQIGLNYWAGFTSGTSVFARGDVDGVAIELYVSPLPSEPFAEAAAPPGEYQVLPGNTLGQQLRAEYHDCASSTDLNATLHIERNDGPRAGLLSEWPGMPVRFEAVLTLSEPGWTLRLPLSISKICESSVDV